MHCLSVCLFVYLYPINIKTTEPIGPKFHVGTHPGKVIDVQNYKYLIRHVLYFFIFWKGYESLLNS